MVTIEQKLTLFSKLLHQDIKEEVDKKLSELDKEYERHIIRNKDKTDKEAKAIVEDAMKRAETKKIELISKGKVSARKEELLTKELYINTLMKSLTEKIKAFVHTEAYKTYLTHNLMQFEELKNYENNLVVYMTQTDFSNHKDYIKDILVSLELEEQKLSFEVTSDTILGGIIIEDPKLNMRIDASITAMLEDSKNHIIELLFTAIGEVGETLG